MRGWSHRYLAGGRGQGRPADREAWVTPRDSKTSIHTPSHFYVATRQAGAEWQRQTRSRVHGQISVYVDFYCFRLRLIMWVWMSESGSQNVYLQIQAKIKQMALIKLSLSRSSTPGQKHGKISSKNHTEHFLQMPH